MTQRMKCGHIKKKKREKAACVITFQMTPDHREHISTDGDDSYTTVKSHRLTARETGQRDRWLGKEVGFIDKKRCQDTMKSKR